MNSLSFSNECILSFSSVPLENFRLKIIKLSFKVFQNKGIVLDLERLSSFIWKFSLDFKKNENNRKESIQRLRLVVKFEANLISSLLSSSSSLFSPKLSFTDSRTHEINLSVNLWMKIFLLSLFKSILF